MIAIHRVGFTRRLGDLSPSGRHAWGFFEDIVAGVRSLEIEDQDLIALGIAWYRASISCTLPA